MDPEHLRRYLQGEASEAESAAVRVWLDADEGLPPAAPDAESASRRERAWAVLDPGLAEKSAGSAPSLARSPRVGRFKRTLRRRALVAGCLALCAGIGITAFTLRAPRLPEAWHEAHREYRSLKTTNGQKAVLTLGDGSVVHLNGASSIRYPEDFSRGARTVHLQGEAFFEVARDPERPFTVLTSETRTRVLGTAFNLRAYHKESTTLSVDHGRVAFGSTHKNAPEIRIDSAQAARVVAGKATAEFLPEGAAAHLVWKDGVLAFENRPLEEIAEELERWYGVTVDIRSLPAAHSRFTGRYSKPELAALAEDLSLTLGIRYRLAGRTLTFY